MPSYPPPSPKNPWGETGKPTEVDVEVEIAPEWTRVRRWREEQLVKVGVGEFVAFRLAMALDVDLHRLVDAKKNGASDDTLIDLYLD